jgi:hypothetical protein
MRTGALAARPTAPSQTRPRATVSSMRFKFDLRKHRGCVEVWVVPNDDPESLGCRPSERGFPVCTATVSYAGRGYAAAFGWIQLVRSTDDASGGLEFEMDPTSRSARCRIPSAGLASHQRCSTRRRAGCGLIWNGQRIASSPSSPSRTRRVRSSASVGASVSPRGRSRSRRRCRSSRASGTGICRSCVGNIRHGCSRRATTRTDRDRGTSAATASQFDREDAQPTRGTRRLSAQQSERRVRTRDGSPAAETPAFASSQLPSDHDGDRQSLDGGARWHAAGGSSKEAH